MAISPPKRVALLLALFAVSAHAATPAPVNEISVGATAFAFASFWRGGGPYLGVEAAYHRPAASEGPWRALRIGGGLRTGFPAEAAFAPVEVFVQAQLTARIGVWEAAAGPEVGFGGYARLVRPLALVGDSLLEQEDSRLGAFYVNFAMAPLRFHFSRFVLSALEVQVGSTAPPFGSAVRIQLTALRLGVLL